MLTPTKESLFLKKYVLDLLKETGKLGSKSASVLIEHNQRLGKEERGSAVDKGSYQRLVGKLIYLSHTKPDIAYAVSVVSQFMRDPREEHLQAVQRVLQYLKAIPEKGLLSQKGSELTLEFIQMQTMQDNLLIESLLHVIACS